MGSSLCSQATHKLLFPDLLAGDIKLNLEGKKTVKTLLGSLLTLFFLFCMASAVSFSLYGYFRTDNPSSFTELYQQSDYPKIELTENSLSPIFFAYLGDTELIESDKLSKYVSFEVTRQTWTSIPQASGKVDTKLVETYFDTVPCGSLSPSELNTYSYISEGYLRSVVLKYGICVKLSKEFYSSGRIADNQYEMIAYKLKPCSLATSGQCATSDEVASINYFLVMPETNLDQNDFTNPYRQAPNMDLFYYINPTMAQIVTTRVKTNTIYDYLGVIPTWNARQSYHDMKDSLVTLVSRGPSITCDPTAVGKAGSPPNPDLTCESYFELWMMSSGTVLTVRRKYKTLVETFGEIGGVKTVLAFLLFLIYFQYNGYAQKKVILQMIYPELVSEESYIKHLQDLPTSQVSSGGSRKTANGSDEKLASANTKLEIAEPSDIQPPTQVAAVRVSEPSAKLQYLEVKDSLIKHMMTNLDVSEIARELQTLRFISSLLFSSEQIDQIRQLALLDVELAYVIQRKQMLPEEDSLPPEPICTLRSSIHDYLDHRISQVSSRIRHGHSVGVTPVKKQVSFSRNAVGYTQSGLLLGAQTGSPRDSKPLGAYSSLVSPEAAAFSPPSKGGDSQRANSNRNNQRITKISLNSIVMARPDPRGDISHNSSPRGRHESPVFKEAVIHEEVVSPDPSTNPKLAASKRISRFHKTALARSQMP